MAEVTFAGQSTGGYPSRDVQFYTPNLDFDVEVLNIGIVPVPMDTNPTVVEYATGTTFVNYDAELFNASPPVPFSENPNDNEFFVSPTGSPNLITFSVVNVDQPQLNPDLNGIGSLVGREVEFIGATAGSTALTGTKTKVLSHTNTEITITPTLGSEPTTTDWIRIDINRPARRSPVVEIILE